MVYGCIRQRKSLLSKDLKEWLTTQGCYKSDTPLYSPRSNGLAERAVQNFKTQPEILK